MATEDQQQNRELEAVDEIAPVEQIRDRILGDLDIATNRSTSSVIASAGEIAALAAAANALDEIDLRSQPFAPAQTAELAGSPQLDVDRLTHELWNGLQEPRDIGGVTRQGYATIVSDDAVDTLHACLARQGFGISTAIGEG